MAKKRKKDKKEDEDYEFTPPEFDEKEFLKKEIKDTKTSLVTIILAVVFGILAGGLAAISRSMVLPSLLIGLAGVVGLKYIYPLLKIDVSHFQKKNWLGSIGTFFFTFLAIFVLLINVPFMDLANPSVEDVAVWVTDGSLQYGFEYDTKDSIWTNTNDSYESIIVTSSASINISANVADNGDLSVVEIAIGSPGTYHAMTKGADGKYMYLLTGDQLVSGSALTFYIRASDMTGNTLSFHPARTINIA
jgi:hypothetical protein